MTALKLAAYAIDCTDPRRLAEFYGRLLGWEIDEPESEDHWVELADPSGGAPLAFQLAPDHRPSSWPSPEVPQMAHLDVRVRSSCRNRLIGSTRTSASTPIQKVIPSACAQLSRVVRGVGARC